MDNATPTRPHAARLALGLVLLSAGLTWLIYGETLHYPYLFDDIIHMRWLEKQTITSVWVDIRAMQHYRPLVMSIWATSEALLGPHNPAPLHLLSLLLHAGNACLAGWIAYQLVPGAFPALATAALYASYPFSYQVLPSPGSHSKPVSAFLILLACALYLAGRTRPRRRGALLIAAGCCAALAPFAYEAAVTAGGFLVLMEYLLWARGRIERPSPWVLTAVLLAAPFLVLWLLVPSGYDAVTFPGIEALWQSSIYFAQGFVWPLALLARPLMALTGLSDGIATALVAYPALALIAVLYIWRRRASVLLVALGWYALALAVQWVTLSFQYVIDAPRLLYLAAVGPALLWGDLITRVARGDRPRHRLGLLVSGISLVALIAWGARFAGERLDLVRGTLAALDDAVAAAAPARPDDRLLFVNVPAWVTVPETDFALGHEGYTVLPPYYDVGLDDYIYVNHGLERRMEMMSLADVRQPWVGLIGYHGDSTTHDVLDNAIEKADGVWRLGYRPERLYMARAGYLERDTPGVAEPLALFDTLALEDVTWERNAQGLTATLQWRTPDPPQLPYTVFVHLYTPEGALLAQADGYPLAGLYPFRYWERNARVYDVRRLTVPADRSLVGHTLAVGIYRSDNGERAPATDSRGQRLADDAYRLPLDGGEAVTP